MVVLGILAVTFAVADHWYGLFVALTPIALAVLTAVATSLDRPSGYIQRVALAVFGFLLFGSCLGHLGYMANDTRFRSLILLLLFSVQLNDVFAYIVGKSLGGPKLAPRTSPNKTIAGSLGAVVLTTLVVFGLSGLMFREGPMSGAVQRLALGLLISIAGQFGDLSVSSIKRDVGVKDTGALIPGHGGVLDRANSLLLSAPTVFHYIDYLEGIGLDQATQVLHGRGLSHGAVELQAGVGPGAPAGRAGAEPAARVGADVERSGTSLCHGLARVYFRLYHRMTVEGAENLPVEPPFILIANHASHLDALALAAALPRRLCSRVFPVAAGDVFFETPVTSIASALILNALPMWRKKCGPHALAELRAPARGRAVRLHPLSRRGPGAATAGCSRSRPGWACSRSGRAFPSSRATCEGPSRRSPRVPGCPRPRRIRLPGWPATGVRGDSQLARRAGSRSFRSPRRRSAGLGRTSPKDTLH